MPKLPPWFSPGLVCAGFHGHALRLLGFEIVSLRHSPSGVVTHTVYYTYYDYGDCAEEEDCVELEDLHGNTCWREDRIITYPNPDLDDE